MIRKLKNQNLSCFNSVILCDHLKLLYLKFKTVKQWTAECGNCKFYYLVLYIVLLFRKIMFYQIWIIYLTLKLILIFKVFSYLFFNFNVINGMELLQQTAMWVCFFILFIFARKYIKVIRKYGSNTFFLFCTIIFIFTDMITYTKFNKGIFLPSTFLIWPSPLVLFIVFHAYWKYCHLTKVGVKQLSVLGLALWSSGKRYILQYRGQGLIPGQGIKISHALGQLHAPQLLSPQVATNK